VRALADELLALYGSAVQAILFYGSCLRTGDDSEGLVDLYMLVDSYRSAFRKRTLSSLNKLLPPNVFYLEVSVQGRVVRSKYAVISLRDFQGGTSMRWFHSYLWGRFAQLTGLVYARNSQVAAQVQTSLARAVITFVTRVLPRIKQRFSARELWREGLLLSYRTELRAERSDNLVSLFDAEPEHYEQLTRAAMAAVPFSVKVVTSTDPVRYFARISARGRYWSRFTWGVRSMQGKLLSILRLTKAFFTFQGGLDYIQWKIERHSGVKVEWTPRLRRHPRLAVCILSWRLYRKGGFR
jgi:hypothetical protein